MRVKGTESHCALLGDAYVHGLMDGEGLGVREDLKKVGTFKLH